jgi:tetratricopeptide (TPR) repeat protein
MEWAVDICATVSATDVEQMRETLEAKLKAESGQHQEAARILWELLVQVRHSKQPQWECITMIHLGKVYKALRWRTAHQLLDEARDLAERLAFRQGRMLALAELGQLESDWGHFAEALALFDEALPLVEPADRERRRALLLAQVTAHEGLNQLDRCRELMAEVLHLDDALDHVDAGADRARLQRIRTALSHRPDPRRPETGGPDD